VENPEVLEATITKAEDTVLHIAVYVRQTLFVTTKTCIGGTSKNTKLKGKYSPSCCSRAWECLRCSRA